MRIRTTSAEAGRVRVPDEPGVRREPFATLIARPRLFVADGRVAFEITITGGGATWVREQSGFPNVAAALNLRQRVEAELGRNRGRVWDLVVASLVDAEEES